MKITIFATIISVLIASTFAQEGCFKPCIKIYDPVCGFNGEQYKIFGNKCLMQNEHCLDGHEWYATKMTKCDEYKNVQKNCEKPCTLELNPVCGFDGEKYQVFPNKCTLKNEYCRNGKKWMETKMNNCDDTQNTFSEESEMCETVCTREYNPVCGSDGKHFRIFSNPCVLKNQHCEDGKIWLQVRSSNCEVENNLNNEINNKECSQICPLILDPVCAFDGQNYRVFDNNCVMESVSCMENKNFRIVSRSLCEIENFKEVDNKDCSQICPLILDPVCAFDGQNYRVFDNNCVMESVSCMENKHFNIVSRSLCEIDNSLNENCETLCTREYSPVCGFDGDKYEIFPNACEMKNKHCKDGHNWMRIDMSHCSTEMDEY